MRLMHHETGRDIMYKTWHVLDDNMLLFVYSGNGSIVFRDNIYPLKRGTLCFLKSGIFHYTMPDKPAEYDRSKIAISNEKLKFLLNTVSTNSSFHKTFAKNHVVYAIVPEDKIDETGKIFEETAETIDSGADCEALGLCNFFRLMLLAEKYFMENIKTPETQVSKAIEYINTNISSPISLDEICNHVHMSKYYFCRQFKNAVGCTVMEYILNTRITAAKLMLSTESASISDVAANCGFSSNAYFSQAFKNNTGMTAKQYRQLFTTNAKE